MDGFNLIELSTGITKAAAHVAIRPSVLDTVKLNSNKYFRLKEENPALLDED